MNNVKMFQMIHSFFKSLIVFFVISIVGCTSGPDYPVTASVNWTFEDGGGSNGINKYPANGADNSRLTVFGNNLYASWDELYGGANEIRVGLYNGNDSAPSWNHYIDSSGTNGINQNPSNYATTAVLTVFGSELYAAWSETNGTAYQIRVAVYNGNATSPAWAPLDGGGITGINKNTSYTAITPQMAVFENRLYVTWSESNGSTTQTRIAVYNGNDLQPGWLFVDGGGPNGINQNPLNRAITPQMVVFANKLYATWAESNGTATEIRMAVYNGNDSGAIWTFVDGGGANGINQNPATGALSPQLMVFNTNLYVIWSEFNGTANQIRVTAYNGNDSAPAWPMADGGGTNGINQNSSENAIHPQLAVFAGKLYASWTEFNGSANQIRVAVTQ
jgi:hypothetical protein